MKEKVLSLCKEELDPKGHHGTLLKKMERNQVKGNFKINERYKKKININKIRRHGDIIITYENKIEKKN